MDGTSMAVSKDLEKNLGTLSLFISMDVGNAMTTAYVTRVAERWFYQHSEEDQRKLFRTNPANTLTYRSLNALFERSVVHISEWLKDEDKIHPVPDEIRKKLNKLDLGLHRNAISHPATINWRDPKMQEFADADRGVYEYLPGLVWDANRSINEELRKGNREVRNETITVTWEMAVLLRGILEMSMNREPPSREHLFAYLQENAAKFQVQLEKHPDGGRDPVKEKERATKKRETWATRRKKWSGQRGAKP
jgi:hypothetical protein